MARVVLLALAVGMPGAVLAQNMDEAAIDGGRKVYKTTGVCQFCHGWSGTGGIPGDEGAAGPPLVATEMEWADIVEVVRCGSPASGMPRHSKTAWGADETCFGMVKDEIGQDLPPSPEGWWLRPSQIEDVASYIIAVYKGKEMTLENCEKFFSKGSRDCNDYR